jgi:hypothetical protein
MLADEEQGLGPGARHAHVVAATAEDEGQGTAARWIGFDEQDLPRGAHDSPDEGARRVPLRTLLK